LTPENIANSRKQKKRIASRRRVLGLEQLERREVLAGNVTASIRGGDLFVTGDNQGNDITIITYGALVERSNQAAKRLEQQGISVELIDLRTLVPYDWEAIAESVKKTSRVIVAHEDPISWGYGAEIAARISNELFEYLDAPVRRVGATDTFVAYAPQVEDFILPQSEDVEAAVNELMKY